MPDDVISYTQLCLREGAHLQRGMNFRLRGGHSVLLMSVRQGAPYRDRVLEDGRVLLYEGHDAPRRAGRDPKQLDQPQFTPYGTLTENGRFFAVALAAKAGRQPPERVQVYEKIRDGVWIDNGLFALTDATREHDGQRLVFVFRLEALAAEVVGEIARPHPEPRRVIPTEVKVAVWKRDGGRCVVCGATDDLHFDHILPFARGGSSSTAENVQLLCARHNLEKGDRLV